jgi:predicted transcriptional regulator
MHEIPVSAVSRTRFFLLAGIAPVAAAGMGHYTIEAVSPEGLAGTAQDPLPISFSDLSLREMLIAVCLSFCPLLVDLVEFLFFLKLTAALGYRKAERNVIFKNRNRHAIYEYITANPGIRFHALERLSGMKEGTLKYHLIVLMAKKRIVSVGSGGSLRYFENNGRYTELEKKVFLHLQNPTTRRILEILSSFPEVSRKDIAGIVGIAGPSITWHTKRLSMDGIITTRRNGRGIRYILCPAGAGIFQQFREQNFGMAAGSAAAGKDTAE